ncbi:UDP-3-O-(3-hydroxymyristoyl)glucosamine N-acyltransferase [Donghicola eburneus]|uniref:UDP-3-O-acylglucosamine N-acyltransferase n=1 Tax=Donghicola eburneus TaxID=393278 RepID=A0A1M4MZ59_9RHOB|nr:UDP-3-O-(3-hydroxymyristoyl)glucosamine N-acyltransferase [Donghicola eburneus]SCM67841.1 UDP-3-O-acylglucosamine N-acyltransferase [Donghicola eburneus]SFQ54609.1 UDP-3-O-[3-hydroxymyristoyl] glucosamine N-acyltransferase [Donghicola eburneus]
MTTFTLAEIAAALGVDAQGDGSLTITRVAEPATATGADLALAMKPEFADQISAGAAQAALLWQGADWQSYGLKGAILMDRPRYGMSKLSAMMDAGQGYAPGIHPTAIIDPTAQIGADASVGPFSIIGAGSVIGDNAVIASHVTIAPRVSIGADALIHPGVRIMADTRIGDRVILHGNVVIGGDGFSFVTPEKSAVEQVRDTLGDSSGTRAQAWARIHSLGGVEIGDDVEVGANSTIDQGSVRATRVGSGTKIDNLVQVGHNVVIGTDCLLCAQAAVAGSTVIGNNCVLGGKSGVADNIKIGDNVVIGAASAVLSNVPAGRAMLGYPAVKMDTHVETYKALRRLPRLLREFAELKKTVSKDGLSG